MIRFGIIGFGMFAERAILPAIRSSGVGEVVALQKRSKMDAEAKAKQYGVPHAFDRVSALVRHADVDAVFIVSANSRHASDTIAAARAGKHVLVEKPMAATVAQAQQMVRTCREKGVVLMVGHMVRFSPVIERMRQRIHEGRIGTVVHLSADFFYDHRRSHRGWLFDRKTAGGGPVHDIGVHCLDTIRYLVDDEVADVRGVVSPPVRATSTERTSVSAIRFRNGMTASICASFEGPYVRSFLEVRGTDGTMSAFDFTKSQRTVFLHVVRARDGEAMVPDVEGIDVPDLYAEEVRKFVHAVETGSEPPVTGEDGLVNQRILDRMLRGR